MNKSFLRGVAVLSGTVIGAGIFGIPYVISKVGFSIGLLLLVLLGAAIVMLNLFLGEVILRTPGNHQLPGYAKIYLGKWGKILFMISMFLVIYGAMIAYIIGEGISLAALFGGNPLIFSLIFFFIASILLYGGIKSVAKSEAYLVGGIFLLMLLIVSMALFSGKFDVYNFYSNFGFFNILAPYGVILFALLGAPSIPEVKECLIRDRKALKKAIILGSLIPIFIYILFTAAVIGITGLDTTEIATIGLGNMLGKNVMIVGSILAIVTMFTSFLTLALAMKETYMFDFKIKKSLSFILTVSIPLIMFLVGIKSFIKVIGITGAIAGSLDGVLIVLMFWAAKKKGGRIPEYNLGKKKILGWILILLFVLGFIYTLVNLI
jgi:tyrosine-specific transport protein